MNLYSMIMRCRNQLYKNKWLKTSRLSCPVIAVGNISVGGTGKTAIVDFLLSELKKQNVKVGVISRGYKGEYKKTTEVSLEHPNPSKEFGDEVSMLKWKHNHAPIFVGKKRVDAGLALLKKYPDTELILADDAYQHQSLYRDLNICLLDMTEDPTDLKVLPFGRLREDFAPALKRADLVLMTKANLSSTENYQSWMGVLEDINFQGPVYKVNFFNNKFIHLKTHETKSELQGRALAFSGLAKPEVFAGALKKNSAINLIEAMAFKDHMSYNKKHIESLLVSKQQLSADFFVTTAKDAIKLLNEKEITENTWVAELDLEVLGVSNYEAQFITEIIGIIRP
ncbi:MAG: tetraacyldisaccharide 4'-kinase [Bdellovibrionales bacterium]|nr:tetraacyldisaccharide 4'-kinase [Bdellovibrionales bacterium]